MRRIGGVIHVIHVTNGIRTMLTRQYPFIFYLPPLWYVVIHRDVVDPSVLFNLSSFSVLFCLATPANMGGGAGNPPPPP